LTRAFLEILAFSSHAMMASSLRFSSSSPVRSYRSSTATEVTAMAEGGEGMNTDQRVTISVTPRSNFNNCQRWPSSYLVDAET
jgi:hypothetical protein